MNAIATVTADLGKTPYTVRLTDDLGHTWLADEPADQQGANFGPSPVRLLIASLGACTAITVKMYAVRKNWPLEGVEIRVKLMTYVPVPESGTSMVLEITLHGPLTPEQRERLLAIANACPVHRILTSEVKIETFLEEAPSSTQARAGSGG
jgi:putative redox protein